MNKKKTFAILALLVVALPATYLVLNHTSYGAALPPWLSADVLIIEGEVLSGRRTLFEDGRGYALDLRTDIPYQQVRKIYADRYGPENLTDAPGMGADFSVARYRVGDQRIQMEIHAKDDYTYVSMAVHLGRWW